MKNIPMVALAVCSSGPGMTDKQGGKCRVPKWFILDVLTTFFVSFLTWRLQNNTPIHPFTMDFSRYNQAEQAQIAAMIEHKQMKDFLRLYSNLVQRCFDDCANDFTTKAITGKEETCINKCADKFLKHSERVGARFAELSQQMSAPGSQ